MECLCTSATYRIHGVLICAFLVEGHSRQLSFDIILTLRVCLCSKYLYTAFRGIRRELLDSGFLTGPLNIYSLL